ncbi:TasA family protein [Streptomyces sp. NPDC050485]|uniref:TasA family protein n=1 Tax=Streptomyces sp. NPDC050485 TaxID=3365617 RepID=UPI0037A673B0
MTTSLTQPTHQGPVQGDGRKKSRKKQWTAAVALLAGAGLLSAGGYAAVQSDVLLKSGVFSVDAAPMADPMDLKVDNAEEFTKDLTFKDMKKGDTVSQDFTLRNKGNAEDIKKLTLKSVTAKSGGQPVSDSLAKALAIEIRDKASGKVVERGTLHSLINSGRPLMSIDVDLPKGGQKAAEFNLKVIFIDVNGAAAAGQSLDSIDFTFRGSGK